MRAVLQPGTASSQRELQRRKSGHTQNVGWEILSPKGECSFHSLPSRFPPEGWTVSLDGFWEPGNPAAAALPLALL